MAKVLLHRARKVIKDSLLFIFIFPKIKRSVNQFVLLLFFLLFFTFNSSIYLISTFPNNFQCNTINFPNNFQFTSTNFGYISKQIHTTYLLYLVILVIYSISRSPGVTYSFFPLLIFPPGKMSIY